MRARDPEAIADIRYGHRERYLNELIDDRQAWLPTVARLRPHLPWAIVLRQIQAIKLPVRSFSERTLTKACGQLVKAEYADPAILNSAPRLLQDTRVARIVADRLRTNPGASLRDIASWLSREVCEPTSRGGLVWSPEGARRVVAQAKDLKLLE